jgi:hypothetical protein
MKTLKTFEKALARVTKAIEANFPSLYEVEDKVVTGITQDELQKLENGRFGITTEKGYVKAGLFRGTNPSAKSFDLALCVANDDRTFKGSNGDDITIKKGDPAFKLVESE